MRLNLERCVVGSGAGAVGQVLDNCTHVLRSVGFIPSSLESGGRFGHDQTLLLSHLKGLLHPHPLFSPVSRNKCPCFWPTQPEANFPTGTHDLLHLGFYHISSTILSHLHFQIFVGGWTLLLLL